MFTFLVACPGASLEGGGVWGDGTPPFTMDSANVGHTTSDSANVGLKKFQEIQLFMISNFNLEVRIVMLVQLT